MTIQDMIDAGITLQGNLTVRVFDGDKTTDVYEGDAQDVDYGEVEWLDEYEISYIYQVLNEGLSIEVRPIECR